MPKIANVILCTVMLLSWGCAQRQPAQVETALRQVSVEWSDDGAGGCLPELVHEPRVRALLQMPNVSEELIALLDSTDSTMCTARIRRTSKPQRVPLGYVCLDILLKSVHEDYYLTIFMGSADDGLWTNVREPYYFAPDILKQVYGKAKMRAVQDAWQKLYSETNGNIWGTSRHSEM